MQEPRDQDLILYYYGEARDGDDIRRRLDASPAAGERYDELCRILELVESQPVPEPWDDYGARLWRRLQPRLAEQPAGRGGARRLLAGASSWLLPRRLAAATTVVALVTLAFLAGRFWPAAVDPGQPQAVGGLAAEGRERILLVSVGEHLERSEMLLIELVNASAAADPSGELLRAEELLPFNRLYRQVARRSGQAAIAEVLDELERLLLDVAHSGVLSAADRDDLRQRIEDGGILFRVQVIGSRVERLNRRRKQLPPPGKV